MSQDATVSRSRVISDCILLCALLIACSPSSPPAGKARPGPGDAGEVRLTLTRVATVTPPIGDAGTPESRPPDQDATQTATPVPAPTTPPAPRLDLAAVIDPLVAKAIDEFDLVGLTIGVRQGKSQPFIRAYGHADVFTSTPTDPATIYPIASITKQFTAAAIMQLVEAGRLSLDDAISGFIGGAPAAWEGITVRHLLNHTSGLADLNEAAMAALEVNGGNTLEEVIAVIESRSQVPSFAPGSAYAYNSVGYYLLGAVVERVTGMKYGEYLRSNIFEPLGLTSTSFEMIFPSGLAQGHRPVNGALQPVPLVHPSLTYSTSGIVSSARDLLAWQQALAEGRVVHPSTYQLMISPTTLPSGAVVAYGYGMGVGRAGCSNAVDHSGRAPGFESYLLYCPDDDMGLVVLLNSNPADPTAVSSLASRLTRAALNGD